MTKSSRTITVGTERYTLEWTTGGGRDLIHAGSPEGMAIKPAVLADARLSDVGLPRLRAMKGLSRQEIYACCSLKILYIESRK